MEKRKKKKDKGREFFLSCACVATADWAAAAGTPTAHGPLSGGGGATLKVRHVSPPPTAAACLFRARGSNEPLATGKKVPPEKSH